MNTKPSTEPVIFEDLPSGVRIIKINRPDVLNALNMETLSRLNDVLQETSNNRKVRAVILTGEGTKAFIAGADIGEMSPFTNTKAVGFAKLGQDATKQLELMSKPTIAAVNGFALGGGTEFAIACDFIFASENAVFGQPEVCLGVIPGFGGTVRLPRFVGVAVAKDLIFSGRRVKADEALRIGLVNQVYNQADLLPETIKYAETICANSASAVAIAKKLLNEFSETMGRNYKLDSEAQEFGGLFGMDDQKEGMKAFVEKRKPAFHREGSAT